MRRVQIRLDSWTVTTIYGLRKDQFEINSTKEHGVCCDIFMAFAEYGKIIFLYVIREVFYVRLFYVRLFCAEGGVGV